jgi:hypothetical protein
MLDFPDLIEFFACAFKNVNPTITSKDQVTVTKLIALTIY